jgi:hypothetical protein
MMADPAPRDYGDDTNYRTRAGGEKNRTGNALNSGVDAAEIPTKDARDHLAAAKPNRNASPPPSDLERSRGYVRSRGG